MSGFSGYGGSWNSYMNASHCWLGQKDFSNYKRVQVKAGMVFGKFIVKKDFEITCAWWNKSHSDHYERENGEIYAHVGIKVWDWSYDSFVINASDSDEDIIRKFAWNFTDVWNYHIAKTDFGGISSEQIAKIKDHIEPRAPFFWFPVRSFTYDDGKDAIEFPLTESVNDYFKLPERLKKAGSDKDNYDWTFDRKRILDDVINYFFSPAATGVKVDAKKLDEAIGNMPIGILVPNRAKASYNDDPMFHPGISFMRWERDFSLYPDLVKFFKDNGFELLDEAALKAAEDKHDAKCQAEYQKKEEKDKKARKEARDAYKGKWWLVKWSGNWADEIDFFAQSVMNDTEVKAFKKMCKDHADESCSISYGTNEYDEDMTFKEYLEGCEFIQIKDAAVREFLLENCDDSCSWAPSSIGEYIDNEDVEDDEEE